MIKTSSLIKKFPQFFPYYIVKLKLENLKNKILTKEKIISLLSDGRPRLNSEKNKSIDISSITKNQLQKTP